MLELCFMLWHAYYAQNYAGIIDAGLIVTSTVALHWTTHTSSLLELQAKGIIKNLKFKKEVRIDFK